MRNSTYNRGQKQQRLSIWNVIAIVVITLIIGIGLYILFEEQTSHKSQWQKPQQATPQLGIHKPLQFDKPGEAARSIIAQIKAGQTNSNLDDVFTRAEEFTNAGQLEDAHLLLFYAARLGHVSSARILGGMYDPNYFDASKSIIDEPDLTQAHKWYKIASDSGDEVAADRLAKLKIAVQNAANKGSDEAKALLLNWN